MPANKGSVLTEKKKYEMFKILCVLLGEADGALTAANKRLNDLNHECIACGKGWHIGGELWKLAIPDANPEYKAMTDGERFELFKELSVKNQKHNKEMEKYATAKKDLEKEIANLQKNYDNIKSRLWELIHQSGYDAALNRAKA